MSIRSSQPLSVYLFFKISVAFLFQMTFVVSSAYYVLEANLDPLQLVLVGTMLEAAVFIFEVPTGIVADLYSRRLSVIIGVFLIGAGFLTQAVWAIFLPILFAQVLWGIGYTFTSGALEAWISDEIGEDHAATAFVRGAQISQLGAFTGALAGTSLTFLSLRLPLLLSGGLFVLLGLLLLIIMPETGFQPLPRDQRTTWGSMLHTLRGGISIIRQRPILTSILGIGLIFGLYSEGFDRLWVAHLLEQYNFQVLSPEVWIGIISSASMLFAFGATGLARRYLDLERQRSLINALMAISAGLVLSLFLFGWVQNLWLAVALYWLITVLREVSYPLYTAIVNQRLDSQVRATVLSLGSMVDAVGQIGGGPIVGTIARQISIRAGLFSSTALLSPVLLLFARLKRRKMEDE